MMVTQEERLWHEGHRCGRVSSVVNMSVFFVKSIQQLQKWILESARKEGRTRKMPSFLSNLESNSGGDIKEKELGARHKSSEIPKLMGEGE